MALPAVQRQRSSSPSCQQPAAAEAAADRLAQSRPSQVQAPPARRWKPALCFPPPYRTRLALVTVVFSCSGDFIAVSLRSHGYQTRRQPSCTAGVFVSLADLAAIAMEQHPPSIVYIGRCFVPPLLRAHPECFSAAMPAKPNSPRSGGEFGRDDAPWRG